MNTDVTRAMNDLVNLNDALREKFDEIWESRVDDVEQTTGCLIRSEDDAIDLALALLHNQIADYENEYGLHVFFDNNYSWNLYVTA